MRYIRLEKNQPINYSIEQLLEDYPKAEIYKKCQMPCEELLADYNVYPLVTTPTPKIREDQAVEEDLPQLKDGEWYQTWKIRSLTEQEIDDAIKSKTLNYVEVENIDNESSIISSHSMLADTETQIYRYQICKSCPSFTILKTCDECGCIMPLKIKIKSQNCPLGKW
jgi:hypothetical protein